MAALAQSVRTHVRSLAQAPLLPLWIGGGLLVLSIFISIVRHAQASEDAAHSPLIIAIASWLLVRRWRDRGEPTQPGSAAVALVLLLPVLALHVVAQWLEWVTIASYTGWMALVAVAYAMAGAAILRRLWFPLAYMLLALPLPQGTTILLTHDIRLAISDLAVWLLDLLNYPVARAGVTIFVDRYELMVEEACSGLNSMISLTAIGLFYAYMRHGSNWRYILVFTALMVAVAMAANFVRVVLLILVTYHYGSAAAQGVAHDVAGLILFAIALAGMFALDRLLAPLRRRLGMAG